MSPWLELGARRPEDLVAERLQLHYAAIVLASVAHSLIEHTEDDSHTNLGIEGGGERLETRRLGSSDRCTLLLAGLRLAWLRGEEEVDAFPLPGRTLTGALEWADRVARREWDGTVARRRFPDFPASPLEEGAPFEEGDPGARAELGRWYANGRFLFERLSDGVVSPIRVWPHHFDLGTILSLGGRASVELGLSPGDEQIEQPYFYCTPDPEPEAGLPFFSGPGAWHTEGFTSIVLRGRELLDAGPDQADTAHRYLTSALAASRKAVSG